MYKPTRIIIAAATAALLLGARVATAEELPQDVYRSDADITLLEPGSWFKNAPSGGVTMEFNPANPAGWAVLLNPRTHTSWHMAFTNPATYAQFMTPQFYAQFLNPKNWLSWVNPASYATFLDPNTYVYWMTPHAYIHALNPENYLQAFNGSNYIPFFDLATYGEWINPAAYSVMAEPAGTIEGGAGVDYFSDLGKLFGYADGAVDAQVGN
ncbi:MAG: hypothetical protein DWQ08_04140 [Proteobacteria bacterium]|nr:MAG: hypothetical protein DWQ08_04140 [Pseudomonadota bacterium]